MLEIEGTDCIVPARNTNANVAFKFYSGLFISLLCSRELELLAPYSRTRM